MIADPVFADILDASSDGHQSHIHGEASPHSHFPSHSHGSDTPSQAENDLAQDKVRSTLRSLVRDWSDEGATERKQCYKPCLEALEKHWKGKHREGEEEINVLVPGCGLGRLAMEIAARGESVRARSQLHVVDRSG